MLTNEVRRCTSCLCGATQWVVNNSAHSTLFGALMIAYFGACLVWLCVMTLWNKLMHIVHGNMGKPSKGKGKAGGKAVEKGKSKSSTPAERAPFTTPTSQDDAHDVAVAVESVLPDAARIRMQTTLLQEEWPVPVHMHQTLGRQGGIAYVPRAHVADVVQRIGFTAQPVAIVVTQSPDSLGLRGYPRQAIRCGISVMANDGERVTTQVERFLVQVGFGPEVHQRMLGNEVQLMTTMTRMTLKMPERHGWPAGPHPASVIVSELTQYIPEATLAEILPREGDSVSFLVHRDYVDILLKNSGKKGIFMKTKEGVEMELLWLAEGYDLQGALKLAAKDTCFGVVEKGGAFQPRFAIRFRSLETLRAFAAAHNTSRTSVILQDGSCLGSMPALESMVWRRCYTTSNGSASRSYTSLRGMRSSSRRTGVGMNPPSFVIAVSHGRFVFERLMPKLVALLVMRPPDFGHSGPFSDTSALAYGSKVCAE